MRVLHFMFLFLSVIKVHDILPIFKYKFTNYMTNPTKIIFTKLTNKILIIRLYPFAQTTALL